MKRKELWLNCKMASSHKNLSVNKYSLSFKIKQVKLYNEKKHLYNNSKRKFADAISDDDGNTKIKKGSIGESTFRGWLNLVNNLSS